MDFYKEWQNIRKEKELNNCISTEFKLNVICFKPKNSDIYKFFGGRYFVSSSINIKNECPKSKSKKFSQFYI